MTVTQTPSPAGEHPSRPALHTAQTPLPSFFPTRAYQRNTADTDTRWNSRSSRKRRYTTQPPQIVHPSPITEKAPATRHHRSFKVHLSWDISFWVALIFVFGSTAWIINGFLLYLPLLDEASDNAVQAAAWAFVGGTLFEIGSYLMVVEALNTGHDQLFGPAIEKLLDGGARTERGYKFRWMGLGSVHDIGYLACSIQLFAASIFWVSTLTGLPGVIPNFPESPNTAITDVFFWTPQVIGGTGFVVASLLLMIEVQSKWWKLNLTSVGWHVGFWNLIGALGFLLCGAFGYASLDKTWINYQSILCTFWGSWAFMIGSVIQLWETLWREDGGQDS